MPLGKAELTPGLVREILNEVKATGVGDNKNVLVELNIETTRHQEIQVIGNGEWCITLGGRDCSLQMHEQKLLEVSVTRESLQAAAERAEQAGASGEAAVLAQDVKTLDAMEEEAARFGEAVGLDSVSTFECIVDRDQHFFMEMNTRIQVEHRVSELCYAMRFVNPADSNDAFVVESLVEAMVLLAAHGPNLPSLSGLRDCRILWRRASMRPTMRYSPVLVVWLSSGRTRLRARFETIRALACTIRILTCSWITRWPALMTPISHCCSR